MTLVTTLAVSIDADLTSALDLVTAEAPLRKKYKTDLTSGTGAGAADRVFSDTRTLGASATENIDVAGVLADALGATITMARVKAIIISAAAGNTNNVVVGGAGSNGFTTMFGDPTDKLVIRPGTTVAIICGAADATGYAVTAGTGDILLIANSAGSTGVTYDIHIIGSSA